MGEGKWISTIVHVQEVTGYSSKPKITFIMPSAGELKANEGHPCTLLVDQTCWSATDYLLIEIGDGQYRCEGIDCSDLTIEKRGLIFRAVKPSCSYGDVRHARR